MTDIVRPAATNVIPFKRRFFGSNVQQKLCGNWSMDEALEVAGRMTDLVEEIAALQPQELDCLIGVGRGRWDRSDPERSAFVANLQTMADGF